MKASDLLQRYTAGERDFRGANLRGQSFKGKDLSGADFSEADIQGTNFTNATLKSANFTGAKAGLQKRWLMGQLLISFLLSALLNFISIALNVSFAAYLFSPERLKEFSYVPGVFFLLAIGITFFEIARQGLTAREATTIAVACVAVCAFAVAVGAGVFAVAVAIVAVGAVSGVFAVAFVGSFVGAFAGISAFASVVTGAVMGVVVGAFFIASTGAVAVAIATVALSAYVAWRTSQDDEKFAPARNAGIAFGVIGGTSFRGANLTDSNFKNSTLKNTNFNRTRERETVLTQVLWQDSKNLDKARVDGSILKNPAVCELLVTRDGHDKSYMEASLQGAKLDGVDLENANLKRANLSDVTLKDANLKNANFTEALVLRTDFTGAKMTGACLEAWNIDSTTNLNQVDCAYVYLRNKKEERRPSSGEFASGEFTKLFREVLSTVDLIFRNGIDWKAFTYSFDKMVLDNQGTELSIQSIENKGDGVVVVRVNAPPVADKAKLHSEFNKNYEERLKALESDYRERLKAKDEEIVAIYRQNNADMKEITTLLAKRDINVQNYANAESKYMSNSNESNRSVNIGGDVTGSMINLGEISDSVSNVINQLPSSPDPNEPGIKERLTELQKAVEEDTELQPDDKADLLEQVKALAEAEQISEPDKKESLVRNAKKIFIATLIGLPATATLVEASSKLLPIITRLLGFPG
jgi:uncharacterized protein YjbI with pentapeptide repeats